MLNQGKTKPNREETPEGCEESAKKIGLQILRSPARI
jgi:hypothetical protein